MVTSTRGNPTTGTLDTWKLCLASLFSGAAALIFENVWFRAAGLGLGNSVWSLAVVTGSFMAGLGLGNLITARWHRRIRDAAGVYFVVELTIAVSGVATFHLLFRGQEQIALLLTSLTDHPVAMAMGRTVVAFVLLVVPAVAIGATLPLLVGIRGTESFGARLARLYAGNTLGAVIGVLACEFFLIRTVGLGHTVLLAAGFNLVAGGIVLTLRTGTKTHAGSETPRSQAPVGREIPMRDGMRLLATVFLTGLNLLAMEVLWFRFFQLFFNGTSKTFAIMLAVVLTGLTVGGAVATRMLRAPVGAGLVRVCCWLAGSQVILAYAAFPWVKTWTIQFVPSPNLQLVVEAGFLMFPLCVLSGALFAFIGRALLDFCRHPVRTTGLLTWANTAGATVGPLLAAFVLLPRLGVETSFFLIAITYGVAGLIMPIPGTTAPRVGRGIVLPVGLLGLMVALFPFGQMRRQFIADISDQLPGATLLAVREGMTETSLYFRHDAMGQPFYHRLVTHSYSMSSTDPRSKRYMKMFAWLPFALNPDSRNALLICFGVGSTASALVDTPWLEQIDIVDISRDVLDSSDIIFAPPARNPLDDPRVNTRVEDGRFHLLTTESTYDLITGEPPPLKISGVVNLYSEEFFRLVSSRLNPGGYCSYWLPVYQLNPDEARAITRAFLNVFPEATLWDGGGLNWILLGRKAGGVEPTTDQYLRQWQYPAVADEMKSLGLESPAQLGANFLTDARGLDRFCGSTSPLTDAQPYSLSGDLEDRSPNAPAYREMEDAIRARQDFEASDWVRTNIPPRIVAETLPFFAVQNYLNYALYPLYHPGKAQMARDRDFVLKTTKLETLPIWLAGSSPQQVAIARELARKGKSSTEIRFHLAAANFDPSDP